MFSASLAQWINVQLYDDPGLKVNFFPELHSHSGNDRPQKVINHSQAAAVFQLSKVQIK